MTDALLHSAIDRMRRLLADVSEGVPLICDSPLFASYEFAADFKLVVEAAAEARTAAETDTVGAKGEARSDPQNPTKRARQ